MNNTTGIGGPGISGGETLTAPPGDNSNKLADTAFVAASSPVSAALTSASDTNVTITLGGSPTTALLAATSITAGWAGTLAAARLNANVVQAFTNDTNVTASITAQNATLSWSGTLAVTRGGTGGGTASGTLLDNITGFSSTGFINRTGAGAYSFIANPIPGTNGGTGINNGAFTLTLGASFTLNGGGTLSVASGKTYTVSNSLTFTGTDATSFAFPTISDTVGCLGTAQTWTAQNIQNVASTIVSATAASLDDFKIAAAVTTITGNTGSPITKLAKVGIYQPTLTDSSAVTVTDASTLYIDNAPAAAGSVTITNAWAIRVGTGNVEFSGTGNVLGTIMSGTWNGSVIGAQYGGTGLATLTAHAVLIGEGTGNVSFATIGTAGRLLIDQGAGADPSFNAVSGAITITSGGVSSIQIFASEAQAEAGTNNTVVMTPQGVSQGGQANDRGFKNIGGRNGGLEVWQRGTSIAVAASTTAYTLDGWYIKTGANQASVIAQEAGLTNNSRYSARVQRNSGQTGTATVTFGFPLDVDEAIKAAGNALVLQFTTSTGANWSPSSGTLTYNVYFGTAAPTKQVNGYLGQTNPISGSVNLAQGASAATTFSSVSSAAGTGITQGEIQFTWTPSGTAGANDWVQIDDVDLRVVPTGLAAAKPVFERSDFMFDLARCQRHYWKTFPYGTTVATQAGLTGAVTYIVVQTGANYFSVTCSFPVTMRATPSITFYNPINNNAKWYNNNLSADSGNAAAAGAGDRAFNLVNNPQVVGDTVPDTCYIHASADASI